MRATILLFDVDGTLLDCGGAGRRALERAFDAACGVPEALARIDLGGMTDRGIARAALETARIRVEETLIDRILDLYVERLSEELARVAPLYPLPGAAEVVGELSRFSDVAVGLGTGNIRPGAMAKLASVGLERAFPFGGFGSDHEQRGEVLRIGAARGAAYLGTDLAACRVVVIGDTPRDVAAARAIGAQCVAVATGRHTVAALEGCGADRVAADLTCRATREWLCRDGG